MLAGIAVDKAIDADLNPGATCKVFQGVDPVTVDLGNLDGHAAECIPQATNVKGLDRRRLSLARVRRFCEGMRKSSKDIKDLKDCKDIKDNKDDERLAPAFSSCP